MDDNRTAMTHLQLPSIDIEIRDRLNKINTDNCTLCGIIKKNSKLWTQHVKAFPLELSFIFVNISDRYSIEKNCLNINITCSGTTQLSLL